MTAARPATYFARQLGAGGEAEVFEVPGRPHLAFKRYRRPTGERAAKLAAMVAHPPQVEGAQAALAWPVEVVHGPGGDMTGFLMPRVDLATSVAVFRVYNPQSRQKVAPAFTWRYLLRTGRNVAAIVAAVHRAGHVVGDLNESNLLVSNRALVSLVDCDSMQITDPSTGEVFPCPVGKPEFTAPELYRRRHGLGPRTRASDSFALGVLVFMLLMEGVHPFAGVWRGVGEPPNIAARIRKGRFPYRRRSRVSPPPMGLRLFTLPPQLRRLAWRACTARPRRRPTPAEWVDALDRAEDDLVECDRSPHHVHGSHLRHCPWCARIDVGLPDPFPGPSGISSLTARPPTRVQRFKARVKRQVGRARRRLRGALSAALGAMVSVATSLVRPGRGREDALSARDPAVVAGAGRAAAALAFVGIEVPLVISAVALGSLSPALALPAFAVAIPSMHAAYQARTRGRGRFATAASVAMLLPGNLSAFARRAVAIAGVATPAVVAAVVIGPRWSLLPATRLGPRPFLAAVWPALAASILVAVAAIPGRVHVEWPAGVAVARARLASALSWRVAAVAWAAAGVSVWLLAR